MSKRNAILAAAASLFFTNGFKGTSMAELSRITGAAGGTIFHHFRNIKPNQELIDQGLANICGVMGKIYPTADSFSRSAVNLRAGAVSGLQING
ncbi:MAG: TetR family transcriptional regulator [Deltaproteobacteria bacterium]|nr:TetR family transcriptional regulator [Deltaproteobacteria bacterium]MBW2327521.1 TetR family transcriptional regulator [Deltaproteobacteria bacterium]